MQMSLTVDRFLSTYMRLSVQGFRSFCQLIYGVSLMPVNSPLFLWNSLDLLYDGTNEVNKFPDFRLLTQSVKCSSFIHHNYLFTIIMTCTKSRSVIPHCP